MVHTLYLACDRNNSKTVGCDIHLKAVGVQRTERVFLCEHYSVTQAAIMVSNTPCVHWLPEVSDIIGAAASKPQNLVTTGTAGTSQDSYIRFLRVDHDTSAIHCETEISIGPRRYCTIVGPIRVLFSEQLSTNCYLSTVQFLNNKNSTVFLKRRLNGLPHATLRAHLSTHQHNSDRIACSYLCFSEAFTESSYLTPPTCSRLRDIAEV